ncbi:hypothetical protein [Streptomyces uncialis]|uniref:Uncharacterized protein n=1 Tax=Streptomyces uncialis TaxID=1048205 RepID=A0A1Q4V9H1_9ACTN|nr:hypothetical protein [Streptomyces uncialis]MCX4658093.1 hypothetical protein [Streptomyces uncialis]OKH94447.1 hypothetical protein AB852_09120 [Streptomyces uncialis]WTE14983.1 hypothetical protein OG924_34950 [Streptomyces uncialis]
MTSLPEISAELATYFSLAAGTLGAAMVASAAQRITDGSIEAGQGCFRRLFRGGSGEEAVVALPAGHSEQRADQLLGSLSPEDRERLAEALTAWVGEQRDHRLEEARLAELLVDAKAPTRTYHVTAHGPNSAAVGSVGDGATFHFGGGGRLGDGA